MKTIQLKCGKQVIVDDEYYDILNQHKWHVRKVSCNGKNCYRIFSVSNLRFGTSKKLPLSLTRTIAKLAGFSLSDTQEIDIINKNIFDCRKDNLRIATRSQVCFHSGIRTNNTSGYKGVSQRKDTKKYSAQIRLNNKVTRLGCFDTAIEAAIAYNKAAIQYFGEFAFLNEV